MPWGKNSFKRRVLSFIDKDLGLCRVMEPLNFGLYQAMNYME